MVQPKLTFPVSCSRSGTALTRCARERDPCVIAARSALDHADGRPRLGLVEGQRELVGRVLAAAGLWVVLDAAAIELHVAQDGIRAPA